LQGNISYIALLRGQYLDIALKPGQYVDIARERGFWSAFDQSFDLPFDLQGTAMYSFILYIVDLVTFTCGIEYFYFLNNYFLKLIMQWPL